MLIRAIRDSKGDIPLSRLGVCAWGRYRLGSSGMGRPPLKTEASDDLPISRHEGSKQPCEFAPRWLVLLWLCVGLAMLPAQVGAVAFCHATPLAHLGSPVLAIVFSGCLYALMTGRCPRRLCELLSNRHRRKDKLAERDSTGADESA